MYYCWVLALLVTWFVGCSDDENSGNRGGTGDTGVYTDTDVDVDTDADADADADADSDGDTRPRLIWTSDFPQSPVTDSDPDDHQTVVRLILYTNEIDIKGWVAGAGSYRMVANKSNFDDFWAAYDVAYPNLIKHDERYPTPEYMRSITYEGKGNNNGISITWGCGKQSPESLIGEGLNSEGSDAIIEEGLKDDPRPLWVGVAGGGREVAQAIWDVKNTRSQDEIDYFISKLRVFLIYCQDGTHDYIMNMPGLFVIESDSCFGSYFCDGSANCNKDWVHENVIRGHGPLGALYPDHGSVREGVQEGDTPAFVHLVSGGRGINDPDDPSQPGWGGVFYDGGDNKWLDGGECGGTIKGFMDDMQTEFAERADWMIN